MNPKRIDAHHHILTPEYVEELAKVGVVEAGGVTFAQLEQRKPEDSLAVMDRNGIETALLSGSSPGLCFGDSAKAREMARSLNEFAAGYAIRWLEIVSLARKAQARRAAPSSPEALERTMRTATEDTFELLRGCTTARPSRRTQRCWAPCNGSCRRRVSSWVPTTLSPKGWVSATPCTGRLPTKVTATRSAQ
jgi:hypothetical protein